MIKAVEKPINAGELIENRIYGEIPPRPEHLSYRVIKTDVGFAAGKAKMADIELIIDLGERSATLPVNAVIPNMPTPCPVIIYIGNEPRLPNKFIPAEEISDRGCALVNLSIDGILGNDADFKSGLAKQLVKSRRRRNAPGKIALWAWAMQRVIDCVCHIDAFDSDNIGVAGHGITSAAALLCGVVDGRVKFVIANDPFAPFSKVGTDMTHLFCPTFAEASASDVIEPLLSALNSEKILIGSAADRAYADPYYEYCLLKKHFNLRDISESEFSVPLVIESGKIHYHSRRGLEYFSREDWNNYLDFLDKNR